MELCKAVILKTQSYSDTRKIIHVYSLEKGYLSLMSPSFLFKRKNNPVHLMQVSEIEYSGNEKSRFQ
ncbi:MAG: recombination protein O N-terminal domain-containing protein, partial [Odoribacter sp.]|nr:recombination protein O N-terminal domain-containing protein [Odoribacter sp.]